MRRNKEEGPASNGQLNAKRSTRSLLTGLALVSLLLTAVSCSGVLGEQRVKGEGPAKNGSQASTDLEHPSLGEEEAPVRMVEYADFQ